MVIALFLSSFVHQFINKVQIEHLELSKKRVTVYSTNFLGLERMQIFYAYPMRYYKDKALEDEHGNIVQEFKYIIRIKRKKRG